MLSRRTFATGIAAAFAGRGASVQASGPTSEALRLLPALSSAEQFVYYNRRNGLLVLDARNGVFAAQETYYAEPVPLREMPSHVGLVFMAAEDRNFLTHWGIDPRAIARAAWNTLGGSTQGGSTITQQVLKEIVLRDEFGLARKIIELVTAPVLEQTFTKEEILFLYVNRVFFGGVAYGIEAAAQVYFGKSARQLTLLEAAALARCLPAPNRFNPRVNLDLATQRAHRLLEVMSETGVLTIDEAAAARRGRLTVVPSRVARGAFFPRSQQVGWATRMIGRELAEALPRPNGTMLATTTIEPRVQRACENHFARLVEEHRQNLNIETGGIVLMRPNGAIVGLVGGRSYQDSEWNTVSQARRQIGSIGKLFVYLAAIERGMRSQDRVSGARLSFDGRNIRNFDDRYPDSLTLEDAFARSSNTAAVRLCLGHAPAVRAVAHRFGISHPLEGGPADLALGTYEAPLIELVSAFATIANGGLRVAPFSVTQIRNVAGESLFTRPEIQAERIVHEPHATAMARMLRRVVANGTGNAASSPRWIAGGKTGTTSQYRDAWFVGFAGGHVGGVWIGNTSGEMNGVTGGGLPARIWHAVMTEVLPATNARRQA